MPTPVWVSTNLNWDDNSVLQQSLNSTLDEYMIVKVINLTENLE
jgi:hypothetical protein